MDVTPLVTSDAKIIQDYRNGQFTISGEVIAGAVLIAPQAAQPWDGGISNLITFAKSNDARVVLLGRGKALTFPEAGILDEIRAADLIPEVMSTDAACRTWQVLLTEGRRVCAALLPYVD